MKRCVIWFAACLVAVLASVPGSMNAQQSGRGLTIEEARAAAFRSSPDLVAARAALEAAAGRVRQAGALGNPTLSYGYEQTGAAGQRNAQSIVALQQSLEFTGVRGARAGAAQLRREAAEAELRAAEASLAYRVTRAFALAVAAEERLGLAHRAALAFERAQAATQARLAAGDASGYEARRIGLETARYAALRASAALARRAAYAELAALVGIPVDSLASAGLAPLARPSARLALSRDSILTLALRRPEVVAAGHYEAAARVDERVALRERIPVPVAVVGWKTERTAAGPAGLSGFVAGLALPLPLWDRRAGAVAAAAADARRRAADAEAVRRGAVREAEEAYAAVIAVEEELERLSSALGGEAAAALVAAETAYAEGEISLIEWLDAVRAYHEAESMVVTLRAELHVRRAALERAIGGTSLEELQ
ncbi:MAG TPA: TolC family protein [Chloroflexota bacterium]|nr:TolC family protein [Chloroflexota bacterium]